MEVIIGIDPHKASHTAVALADTEVELARLQLKQQSISDRPAAGVGQAVPATTLGDRGC